jgi:hypothetical protein
MSADAGFRIRAREVRAYLRSLYSLEQTIVRGEVFIAPLRRSLHHAPRRSL